MRATRRDGASFNLDDLAAKAEAYLAQVRAEAPAL